MPTNTTTGMAAHLDAEAIAAADHAKLKDRARKAREKGRDDSVYADAIAAIEAPTPDAAGLVERLIGQMCRDVAELPDRDSPDDWPEAMLVTSEELEIIASRAFDDAAATIAAQAAEIERLREGIADALVTISGGLCYFTAEAKHAQLRDADKELRNLTRSQNDGE